MIDCENGIKPKFLLSGEKQLSEIKDWLKKDIGLIVKKIDLDEPNEKTLSNLLPEITYAQSSADINKIVESIFYFFTRT